MVKIIVMGAAGRMGQAIISLMANETGVELAGAVDVQENLARLANLPCVTSASLADVLAAEPGAIVINFTAPAPTMAAASAVARAGAAMVIGTTGLTASQKSELEELAIKTPLLWSGNMSVGINALLRLLPQLVQALGPEYDLEVMELHHKHKKDAPSGTALMLAEALAGARGWELGKTRKSARDGMIGERKQAEIGVQALRGGDVVGIHSIYFLGVGEMIEIKHQAQSRENFAQGALRAAVWLSGQKAGKLYSMQDVIG